MSFSDRAVRCALAPLFAAIGAIALDLIAVTAVLADSPSPSAAGAGDPRSAGQGPGLGGAPLFAIGIVGAIGIVALVGTRAYVRATGGSRRP